MRRAVPSTYAIRRAASSPALRLALCALVASPQLVGCGRRGAAPFRAKDVAATADPYVHMATAIEYPEVSPETAAGLGAAAASLPPRTLSTTEPASYREVELEEVIRLGLENADVLRGVGGTVVRNPDTTRTVYDPAIRETDAATGVEAALSAFDAQFTTSLFTEKNDRALNNQFFGGGTRLLQQDSGVSQTQLAKRGVSGTEMALRHIVEYDANNAPANLFNSAWTVKAEAEARQPLLQGAGIDFNRIAGPTRTPGVFGGVLLARVNTDIELADFELAVRDYVSNLENAYWDLYFAYRDLDARVAARDSALDTWRRVRALYETGRRGGEAEKEAQAREQYYRFEEEVQNALAGRPLDGTQVAIGIPGGAFRVTGGVYFAERRLRLLMGLPASDGELLRPTADPALAPVALDWDVVASEAVDRRAELRRQRWRIRRRELELLASRNHLLPRLDVVGRYRFRGFGDQLLSQASDPRFNNAYGDLTSGDFQEWQLGFEFDAPIGFRRAHNGVRNAELQVARERALLADEERAVVHQVAEAVAELERAYAVSQTGYNRMIATREQLAAVQAAFDADKAPLDQLLDAQRRLAEAESRYYRALVEHAIALKNVHFTKGTLLEFDGVHLAEGPWPGKAYADASERVSRRGPRRLLNYSSARAPRVSLGTFPQNRGVDAAIVEPGAAPRPAAPLGETPAGSSPGAPRGTELVQPIAAVGQAAEPGRVSPAVAEALVDRAGGAELDPAPTRLPTTTPEGAQPTAARFPASPL